ncbi:MAG: Sir2 family NAD-dependent protein deacetylase, partial [Actinomycetes bacterium]
RYWARSHLGWSRIAAAEPNDGHRAVAALQQAGLLTGIVTQNVDGLQQRAGAWPVLELHGALSRVVCLDCGGRTDRWDLEARLRAVNGGWSPGPGAANPDGDLELADDAVGSFVVVDCRVCGGTLKPDVVFFGETVPPARVAAAFACVERSRALLVLGSSLTVMSGRRFVLRAAALGIPVAIVNQGVTRGDPYAGLVLDAPLGPALAGLVETLHVGSPLGSPLDAGLPPTLGGSMIGGTRGEGRRP